MKKILFYLLCLGMAMTVACTENTPLADDGGETESPATPTDPEIIIGTKVDPFGAVEGTLHDKAGNSLMAYVYGTKLDVLNGNAYVSYATKWLCAQGYMTFVSGDTATDGVYPVDPVGFQREEIDPDTQEVSYVDSPQYYPGNTPIYMVALVPAKKTRWTLDSDCKVASCIIDGRTDIMVAVAKTMNDGTSPIQKKYATASVYPVFNFKHKGTLIRVRVYCPEAKDLSAWGKITKIELAATAGVPDGVNTTCSVTLEDGTGSVSGAAAGAVHPFYYYGGVDGLDGDIYSGLKISTDAEKAADTLNVYHGPVVIPAPASPEDGNYTAANSKIVGYSIVAPFEADATGPNATLRIYSEKHASGVEASIPILYQEAALTTPYTGSTEGKKFDVTLKLTGNEIIASGTITDWVDVYGGEIEL